MNIDEFFALHAPVFPVFVTTKDITVDTYRWVPCCDPYSSKKTGVKIPAGTRLVRNAYSNFGDGYSMSFEKPVRGDTHRWFRVNYADMKPAAVVQLVEV